MLRGLMPQFCLLATVQLNWWVVGGLAQEHFGGGGAYSLSPPRCILLVLGVEPVTLCYNLTPLALLKKRLGGIDTSLMSVW